MTEIDYKLLNADTLNELLAEVVSREGTDYGNIECPTETQISQLKSALVSGSAVIVFDAVSGYCNIIQNQHTK